MIVDNIEVEVHRNYYETGELNQEWLQTTYELHGYHKTFYKSGQLKQHIEYRKNEWFGVDNRYFENGNIEQQVTRLNDSLYLNEAWFSNGIKRHEYNQNSKRQRIGNETVWFENGNLNVQIIFSDSSFLNGDHLTFYENGKVQLKARYENGLFKVEDFYTGDGIKTLSLGDGFIETYKNNKLKSFDIYKNGLRNGICKLYSEDGVLRNEANFVDGKSNGKSIWYKANGEIEEIIYMENDVMTHRERN